MDKTERIQLFQAEIAQIENPCVREFVQNCLSKVPEYFFHIPASSSGKYHPAYALGEGGLVRHTKAAVKVFCELISSDFPTWYLNDTSLFQMTKTQFCDTVIAALILHDSFKWGKLETDEPLPEGHTVHEHPLIAADFVASESEAMIAERKLMDNDTIFVLQSIRYAIASHMGKWTISKYSSYVLPSPNDWLTRVVHLCDLLASRKCIDVHLD